MARNIVSTQIIQWKFDDQVSAPLQRVQQNLQSVTNMLNGGINFSGVESNINKVTDSIKHATESVENLTKKQSDLGKNDSLNEATTRVERYSEKIRKTPKERFTDFKNNITEQNRKTESFIEKIKKIPKTVKSYVELKSETATTRVERYHRKILQLPKEKITRLKANIDKGFDKFKTKLSGIPKKIDTFFQASNIEETTNKADRHRLTLKGIIGVSAALALAQKGLQTITSQLGSAFERSDAIFNYGKTMKILGYNQDEVSASSKRLIDMVTGTAFGMDQASQTTKTFVATTGDLKKSEERTKDLMKAVTVFGDGSKNTFDMVALQMGQMSGKLKANMGDLRSLYEGAPGIATRVAEKMGKSMSQLSDDMEKGSVKSEDYFDALHQVMEGFQDDVLKGNDTWQKVFDNSKAKITQGLTSALENLEGVVNKTFGGNAKENIVKYFDGIGKRIEEFGTKIGEALAIMSPLVGSLSKIKNTIKSTLEEMNKGNKLNWKDVLATIVEKLKILFEWLDKMIPPLLAIGKAVLEGLIKPFSDLFGKLSEGKGSTGVLDKILEFTTELAKHPEAIKKAAETFVYLFGAFKGVQAVGRGARAISVFKDALSGNIVKSPFMNGLAVLIKTPFNLISKGLNGLSVGFKLVTTAMKANPFIAIATAVIAVGFALYELYKHNKKFKKFVDNLIENVKEFFSGIGKWFGKTWDKIMKVVDNVKKSFGEFWKGITDDFDKAKNNMGKTVDNIKKSWDGFWKGLSDGLDKAIKNGKKTISKVGKGFEKYVLKPIEKVLKTLGKIVVYSFAFIVGVLMTVFEKPVKFIIKLLTTLGKSIAKIWNGISKTTTQIFGKIGKSISKVWTNVSKSTIKIWNNLIKSLTKIFNSISKTVSKIFSSIAKTIGSIWQSVSKTTSKVWNSIYKFISNILNKVFKFFKKIFTTIWEFITDVWDRVYSTISDILSKIFKTISRIFTNVYNFVRRIFNSIFEFFGNIWSSIFATAERWINKIAEVIHNIVQGISENWSKAWNGIKDVFGKVWDGIKELAGKGINFVIKYVNKGVDGINKVIHAFGGKDETIKPLEPVKLATGTKSHRGGFAHLNDDGSADPRELVILPNGKMLLPQKRDAVLHLPQGTEVLNSRETKEFFGGNVPKYAEGTGIWDKMKGLFGWVEDKVKAIADFVGHPVQSLTKVWDKVADSLKPKNLIFGNFAYHGGRKLLSSGANFFKNIFENLKGKLEEALDSGSGSRGEFIKNVLSQKGKQYVWGASGPDTFDCSGLIMWALEQVGIKFPHYTGDQWNQTEHISENDARKGDLVFFGNNASRHVGMFTKKGEMFNAAAPDAFGIGNGIGYSSYDASDLFGFGRIRQLSDGGGAGGNFHGNWAQAISSAAAKMKVTLTPSDIRDILSLIQHESGGNEKIVQSPDVWDVNTANGNPAKGLLQYIPQTFAAYAMPGHTNIFSGYDQLLAFFNTANWRNFNPMGGWGPSGPRRFALGGKVTEPTLALIGETGEDEYVINPNKPTASALIESASRDAGLDKKEDKLSAKLANYLEQIISALNANKKIYLDIGGELIEITDKKLGDKQLLNDRLFLGGSVNLDDE